MITLTNIPRNTYTEIYRIGMEDCGFILQEDGCFLLTGETEVLSNYFERRVCRDSGSFSNTPRNAGSFTNISRN